MMAIETIAACRSFVEELLPQTAIPSGDFSNLRINCNRFAHLLHERC
jgi:hypothetical protein